MTNEPQSVSVTATSPPGRAMRASSTSSARGSSVHCRTRSARTSAALPSAIGSDATSPWSASATGWRTLAVTSMAAEVSTSTTVAPTGAAAPKVPGPAPTSTTRSPAPTLAWSQTHQRAACTAGQASVASIIATSRSVSPSSTSRKVRVGSGSTIAGG